MHLANTTPVVVWMDVELKPSSTRASKLVEVLGLDRRGSAYSNSALCLDQRGSAYSNTLHLSDACSYTLVPVR